ncbi:MAG: glycosyltransferase [Ilumatobacteraceae bacterium]
MVPVVSVLTTVFDPSPGDLEACLASVRDQTMSEWQHVVVDDASTEPYVAQVLAAAAAADDRLTVVRRSERGGPVAAGNDGLAAATGEFVALLAHDDVLEPTALRAMVRALTSGDGADLAYSDHDELTADGLVASPVLKPDFSPEQLRNQNYVLHFVVARRSVVESVGGFRPGFDGAHDHDLLLRLSEHSDRIVHVPAVLYHQRHAAAKGWASDAGVSAVQEHCDRVGIDATVEPGTQPGTYRVRRHLAATPRISVVIPTRGGSRRVLGVDRCFVAEAVRSMVETATYPDLEFVVVYDTPTPVPVLDYLRAVAGDRLVLVEYTEAFNFSEKINVGVAASSGELVLLLNDDTELNTPDALETMAAHLDDPTVGMVGPKLLFPDGTIQDGGHVYNEHVLAGLVGWHGTSPGPGRLRPLAVEREVSGVTAAAALVRRDVFDEIGGFDPALYINFNDVDVSLKIRATGRRIVWTPYARWYHFESQTREASAEPEEWAEIDRRWHDEINADPYYNPRFEPRRSDWLERPWHSGAPVLDADAHAQGFGGWLLDRLRGALTGSSDSVWWRAPLVALVLFLASWLLASEVGLGPNPVRRILITGGAAAMWCLLLALTLHRRRWVLAAALLTAVAPATLAHLAVAGWEGVAWAATVIAATFLGPVSRVRPAAGAAVAAVVVGFDGLVWWSVAGDRPAVEVDPWNVLLDLPAAFGHGSGTWTSIAVGVWWLAVLIMSTAMSVSGQRVLVYAFVTSLAVVVLAAWGLDSAQGAAAPDVGSILLVGVLVALAARVDHEMLEGGLVAVASVLLAAVMWSSTLFEVVDGLTWRIVVIIVLGAAVGRVAVGLIGRREPV